MVRAYLFILSLRWSCMDISNLTLLGTSHIASESVIELRKAFEDSPDIVCLELDKARFISIQRGDKSRVSWRMIRQIGVVGYLFALVGGFAQKKLASIVGNEPGVEMREAIKLCTERKMHIYLIDQRMDVTLKKLSREFTWREKIRLPYDFLKNVFKKRKIPFDLNKIPEQEIIEELTLEMRNNYPNVYKVLVSDRNVYMARAIAKLIRANPEKKILAVVGAGHVRGMTELLRNKFD